jgi:surface polysaccharide O-acyltransferase-like enzyme
VSGDRMSPRGGHLFIDNIRHLSMLGVVLLHCYPATLTPLWEPPLVLQLSCQGAKFCTIAFFLVAGYLLGERIDQRGKLQYLWRRVSRLGCPWLAWFSIYCALLAFGHWLYHRPFAHAPSFTEIILGPLFGSAFWFVPNMLFALCVLLLLSRHIDDWRWGAALLTPALFYAINIYGQWVNTRHSTAFTGFVGYLWLGAWAARNWNKAGKVVSAVSTLWLSAVSIGLLLLALWEARILMSLHSPEPQNTLRITNQLFSISAVLLLLRVRTRLWPAFLNVREHTFGIYLTHSPVTAVVGFVLLHSAFLTASVAHYGAVGLICWWGMRFACTYALSVLLTILMAQSPRVSWMIGVPGHRDAPTSIQVAIVGRQPTC